ncbi:hypothetical protein EV356DRAFT_238195 [Viridothelium virens]|uniref:Uncharacterized protein n=1 Tax=Viridothelium virens TaxID=1048519 RepID=A0A6A6H560_VIRVR|nr:hypothetical protein EV356DRAFT_238195 [Viridothelium virens]
MSNPGQAQPGSNMDSFITPEEIDSFTTIKDDQKGHMKRYLKEYTDRIQASPEGSAEHQQWVQKLKEFNTKLKSQLYKQQQLEHAQQAQNRIAQQGQAKSQPQPGQTRQAQQGQQQSGQPATQQGSQQSQYSAEVVQRVRTLQVPYPPEMPQADAQKYVQEQRKHYATLLSQHESAEKMRLQQGQLAEQKRSQGQDPSQELSKVARAEDYLRKNKINIETFERKHMEIRARQQAAQQNGGAVSTTGSQTQQNISQPGQTRPNQQPAGQTANAGAENGRSPTSPTRPAQQQSQSQQQSQHATTQPPLGAHPNLPQLPQQNPSQQQTGNANAPRPPLNIQQANAQTTPQLSNQTSPRGGMHLGSNPGTVPNGVHALSHEAAISAAARSYSQSQTTATQQPSSTSTTQPQQQQQQQQQPNTNPTAPPNQQQQQQRPTPQSTTSGPAPPPLQTGSNLHLGGSGNGTPSSSSGVLSGAGAGYVGGAGGAGGGGGGGTVRFPIPKTLNTTSPAPVSMGAAARPTLGGPVNGAPGVVGQPAVQKQPGYILEGEGDRVLSKKKLDELVRQVTGGGEGPGESLTPEVEEVSF